MCIAFYCILLFMDIMVCGIVSQGRSQYSDAPVIHTIQ